jgi:phospholipid/cholesterol/gamma-HCH transport system substrate-binding protein
MRRWTNEVVVGVAILLAIAIGIYGYVYLREIPMRQRGYEINIVFDNITGLEAGDAVTVAGLKVGKVKQMRLDNSHVAVRVWMNGEVPFPRNSRAALRSIGMIGEKYIDLMPGTAAETLQDGDTIAGAYIDDLADAGDSLSDLMSQATSLLSKLNTVMDSALSHKSQNAIAATLANTERITDRMEKNLEHNMRHLENTLASLDTLSSGWKTFWLRHRASIDSTSQHITRSAAQLPRVVAQIDSALMVTRKLLAQIDNQQGTVGKALHDDEAYNKANRIVDELQALVTDMKKNPGKYLQVSVIRLF